MAAILILSLNARFSHTAYGAMCLRDSLGELKSESLLLQFSISQELAVIVAAAEEADPKIIGIGVYIWNRTVVEALVPLLRKILPGAILVLGGPEISYDLDSPLSDSADCVISGEGEDAFGMVCRMVLGGGTPPARVCAELLSPERLRPPLEDYTDDDIAQRVLYVESSRGCPCRCSYCLSARDEGVRLFNLDILLPDLECLIKRGAMRLKFIDRSFNIYEDHAARILLFLLEHWREGMQVHFEMTPQLPGERLRDLLLRFPRGGLHIEIGVQTLSPQVSRTVGRSCKPDEIERSIRFFVEDVGADVHADLIAALPGESMAQFCAGFDSLVRMHPCELQVGILKRLHGAPLSEESAQWGMVFSDTPPYEVQSTDAICAGELSDIRRFAAHWERVANRGHFPRAIKLLLSQHSSPYRAFDLFSRELEAEAGIYGVALVTQHRVMLQVLRKMGVDDDIARQALREDYLCGGKRICLPRFLR